MKKRTAVIFVFVFIVFSFPECMANPQIKDAVYSNSEIDDIANSNLMIEQIAPGFSFSDITDKISSGDNEADFKNIISSVIRIFSEEIYININTAIMIIIIAVLSGIINNLTNSYDSKTVSHSAFFTFSLLIIGLIVKSLKECLDLALTVISDEVLFMKAAIPVYSALIVATGNPSAAAGMEPVFLFFVQLIGSLMEKGVIPMVFWIEILNIVNSMTDKFSTKKLIEFVKHVIRWGMGIIMTLFVGILGFSGFTASIANGMGIKTMKYAVGNFVPVVGGLLSDTVDTVISSISVLKNAIGISGAIALILMCCVPIIKMIVITGIFKLSAGIIEPITDKRISTIVSEAGNTSAFIFTVLLAITIMFIIGITITIGATNKLNIF